MDRYLTAWIFGAMALGVGLGWLVPGTGVNVAMTKVLFLCTGNSCRSQMAEGFLRAFGGDAYEAHSAGTRPSVVNPLAVEVMREIGVDISGQRSKNVTEYVGAHFPLVITVCDNAKEHCPIFPGPCVREHWPFDDPADAEGDRKQKLAVFRRVRDEIGERIKRFVTDHVPTKG